LRYGEDFVLLAKGGSVLQGVTERLIDIDKLYGMEKMLIGRGHEVAKTTITTRAYVVQIKLKNV
jgi:hypothetical protein